MPERAVNPPQGRPDGLDVITVGGADGDGVMAPRRGLTRGSSVTDQVCPPSHMIASMTL
jgi:hypothetical protein